jgi:predicted ATP-grasp superfamily ATP-dependent carboligase
MHNFTHAVVMGDLNLVRCFLISKIPYIPVATTRNNLIHYSRNSLPGIQIVDPGLDEEKSVNSLINLAGNKEIKPILFYSNDQQLLMVSKYKERLSQYFKFLTPENDFIEAVVDKKKFIELCSKLNLPTPSTYNKDDLSVEEIKNKIPYPCVIKPTTRFLWKINGVDPDEKVILVNNAKELDTITSQISEDKDYVIQEYIDGTDDLIYSYHAFIDENHNCLASFCGKKLKCKPIHNGYSASVCLIHNEQVKIIGESIINKTQLIGPIKIDFKYSVKDDTYYLLELNPRFNMWHYLGSVSGINIPQIAYQYLQGVTTKIDTNYRTDIKWFNIRRDLAAGFEYYRSSRLSLYNWLKSYSGKKIYDKFSWNDPLPAIMGVLYFIKHRIYKNY